MTREVSIGAMTPPSSKGVAFDPATAEMSTPNERSATRPFVTVPSSPCVGTTDIEKRLVVASIFSGVSASATVSPVVSPSPLVTTSPLPA